MSLVPDTKSDIAVSVSSLEKTFGNFTAVNKISFEIKRGEIFGFLGPNGAGKSTTIRMLCGILTPTSGSGTVGGFDIIKEQEEIKQNIGYMSQKFSLYDDLTVEENIDFYGGIYTIPRATRQAREESIIKMAGIEEFRTSLTRTLSGGWKQRLALGCAIIHEPKIIFLDEPTSGVDPITRANFWGIIKDMAKRGVTVFVTTHYMDEAENCDRMTLIYKGNMIAMGTPQEMKTKVMKDEVLEVIVPVAEDWVDKVQTAKGVKESALFSTKIHAVVEDSLTAIPAIKEIFAEGGLADYDIRKITPSLEDVFVSSIEAYDKEHPSK
ncbi:MAG: ABC transporter ATP-binding protein [Candidatus Omnitrophica bacterium]|nr:ABC transporter ATP-binding protein [Candidatus Omnitrophota bacterium]